MNDTRSASGEKPKASFGVTRDLNRLKANASASLGELREFLAQTRGRKPQEVLGMVAGNSLVRSIGWAVVGTVVLLIVGTIVPYWFSGPPHSAHTAKARPAAPKANVTAPSAQADLTQVSAPSGVKAADQPSPDDAKKAIKVMGLGETKVADPKKNPMDKNLDNLLDKLE